MKNKTVRCVKKLVLVHKIFYDKGPKYMGQNFSKWRDLHHHSTRGKHYNFVVPNVNGMTSTTFYFNAIKDWNSLPVPLKSTKNFQLFKSCLKEFIFNRCRQGFHFVFEQQMAGGPGGRPGPWWVLAKPGGGTRGAKPPGSS